MATIIDAASLNSGLVENCEDKKLQQINLKLTVL
jgi:hypothetical protein